jgi:hypothetical protein
MTRKPIEVPEAEGSDGPTDPVTDPVTDPPPPPEGSSTTDRSARAALVVFVVVVVAAFPLYLFRLGTYHWFMRDDWAFITGRSLTSPKDLFAPWDTHWSTIPIIVFRLLWKTVGLRSYKPYQAVVVALHLTAVVLLRMVMRRAGVGPWLATAAASALIFFGPGSEDIVWAFQVGFTGSVVFGLTQLLLCDHEGGLEWRDGLGVVAGVLALMSSGIGVVMALVVGLAMLLRRGWKIAAVLTAPLAVVYGVYWLAERPRTTSAFGAPTAAIVLRWVRSAEIGAFQALGHYPVVSWLLLGVLVAGLALALSQHPWTRLRGELALPLALLVGSLVFAVLTAIGRWPAGENGARAGRFVYLSSALLVPALAVAAQAIARRWRVVTPALAVLFLVAVPANSVMFGDPPFGRKYFAIEQRVLTTITRMPSAAHVPGDVRPISDRYLPPGLDMSFLRNAVRNGQLRQSSGPISLAQRLEYQMRLGLDQKVVTPSLEGCKQVAGPVELSPAKGSSFRFLAPMTITSVGRTRESAPVAYDPSVGQRLQVDLSGLHLRLQAKDPLQGLVLCDL